MTVAPTPLHDRHAPARRTAIWAIAAVLAAAVVTVVLLIRWDVFQSSSSSGIINGSGTAATQTRDVSPFTAIDLAGSSSVDVVVGGTRSVVVHADDNLLNRLTTRVDRGTLVVGTRGSFSTSSPMRVDVRVPTLDSLTLSGSGAIVVQNVKARSLTLQLTGSGMVRASGTVANLDVSLGGSGDAQLDGLVAHDARAVVTGTGRILVHATSSLDASMRGTGAIIYIGNPAHVTTSITGTGAIARG